MGKTIKYEKRLTLFIDFMGFKDIVEGTAADNEALNKLVGALEDAASTAKIGNKSDFHVSQFSDCLVISYKVKSADALFEIVNKLSLIVVRIIGRGYLLRGGLTYGELHHSDTAVLGPAMNRAYYLESEVAKYPRVILDPEVFNELLESSPEEVVETIKQVLVQDENDGIWYFDYISSESVAEKVAGEFDFYPKYLAAIADLIKRGLKHQSPGVLAKYIWLHERYRLARESFLGFPSDHSTRTKFPRFLESIEELPSLNRAVTKAKEIVVKAAKDKEPLKSKK
ncbi:hypothetical protein YA0002_17425 [Pseudomonas cichorii]|uniref:hypothetical protein n=1 Tax=Pseudomonas cichorii TaxID=36746 RepID=UPI0018E65AB5|nr:hypothetical protein [Pseudomonas cichorii]MBI6854556.1 hypothetical protein [Pseudomonas cichorii]